MTGEKHDAGQTTESLVAQGGEPSTSDHPTAPSTGEDGEARAKSSQPPHTSRRLAPPPKPKRHDSARPGSSVPPDAKAGSSGASPSRASRPPEKPTRSSPPEKTPPVAVGSVDKPNPATTRSLAAPPPPSTALEELVAATKASEAESQDTPPPEPVPPEASNDTTSQASPSPPPRPPSVPPPTRRANDDTPASALSYPKRRSSSPPERSPRTSSPAIQAMRIIAVGGAPPSMPQPSSVEDAFSDIPVDLEDTPLSAPPAASHEPELDASEAHAALPEPEAAPPPEKLAPSTPEETPPPSEPGREDAISLIPEEVDAEATAGTPEPAAAKPPPPPPPRRPVPPTPPKKERQRKQTKPSARRPWWEDVFSEDYHRSFSRLSDSQVRREVDFIEESLGVASGGVVLDLCCGTGQHTVELSSRGYGVVGYDLSLYQLALAADVAQERSQKINFLQGDVREMAFEEMFDGVFCWNTSFGYFEEEKNVAVAKRIFDALRPGGMFLLDVANRDFVSSHQPSQVWFEGDGCVCMDDMSIDFITSRLRVKRSLILDDGRTRECSYSIRLYSLHELGKLLHDVGFRVAQASGEPGTPGIFFGQCSPRIIILAQKPELPAPDED